MAFTWTNEEVAEIVREQRLREIRDLLIRLARQKEAVERKALEELVKTWNL